MKRLFFDLETTGLDHKVNGVHQVAGIIEVDGVEVDEFDIKVRPHHLAKIDKTALDIGGVTLDIVAGYQPIGDGYKELISRLAPHVSKFDKMDKMHLVGYNNASFDNQFLRAFFAQNGDKYFGSWFWSDTHDVMVLASKHLEKRRHEMPNFKLATVAEMLGISVKSDNLHDGIYDVRLTKEIYDIVT